MEATLSRRDLSFSGTGKVHDWNAAAGNSAADARILFHTSWRPAPVLAEKGITGAVGYASVKVFTALRN